MVNTRGSQGVRKRRPSSTEPPSDAGSTRSSKIRRTTRRRFTSANEQLQDEEREASLELSQKPSEQPRASSITSTIHVAVPTRSHKARHSLPATLQIPDEIKLESLQTVIARRIHGRQSDGIALDGASDFEEDANTYIDPADLDVRSEHVSTPTSRSMIRTKHMPIAVSTRPSPNTTRENEITEYKHTIVELNEKIAHLSAKTQHLSLGARSLGFGTPNIDEEAIFAEMRTEFDILRSQEADMNIDLDFDNLSNQELLKHQPDIIRGLLHDIDEITNTLEDTEIRLAFSDAEYKGVLGKLVEREERNEALEFRIRSIDQTLDLTTQDLNAEQTRTAQLAEGNEQLTQQLNARDDELSSLHELKDRQANDLSELRATCAELHKQIDDLKEDIRNLLEEHAQQLTDAQVDNDERVDLMAEELEQEHHYRLIAEEEISSKDLSFTRLQIQFQQTKSDLEDTKTALTKANEVVGRQNEELETLYDDGQRKEAEKQELDEAFEMLERKAAGLEEDIKALAERHDQAQQKLEEQGDELQDAEQQCTALEEQKKRDVIEINKLRAELFGIQQERDELVTKMETTEAELQVSTTTREELDKDVTHKVGVIEKLEANIDALNKAVEKLQEEKDQEINDRNARLDEHEATIDQQESEIDALREENRHYLADREELRVALALRGEEVRILKDVNSQLLVEAEEDVLAAREFANRKIQSIALAKETMGTDQAGAASERTVMRKVMTVKTVEDSGYHGSETDDEDRILLASN